MLNFLLRQTVRILLGPGTVAQVGEILESTGKKKAFVATDKGIVKAGIAEKVIASLKNYKIDYVLFDEILPDAPAHFAEQGYEVMKKENCDCAVALGGGSTIDTTKAINLLRFNEGPLLQYTMGPPAWAKVKASPGLVAIPTTAGTGSEMRLERDSVSVGLLKAIGSHLRTVSAPARQMMSVSGLERLTS